MKQNIDVHGETKFILAGIIILIILTATWLRLFMLATVPPGLWFDEAYNAMDAVWMLDTKSWPIFLPGNHGREALYLYLLALSTTVLGETPYAVRMVSAVLGILSIPLMYRWSLTIFKGNKSALWLALVSTAGLAVSLWFLVMNRTGYRANLLPLFVMLVAYFFWRGWEAQKIRYYLVAGVALGLSQYTYFSARLLPLVFALFLLMQTALLWKADQNRRSNSNFLRRSARPRTEQSRTGRADSLNLDVLRLKQAWLGLAVMAGVSALVAAPMLWFLVRNPQISWDRTLDVAVKFNEGVTQLSWHLLNAVRVFIDGQDPNWRHQLLGRPALSWFSIVGFWSGLFVAIKNYRRPVNLFLLLLLLVMWLPAPLAAPPLHTLRLSGILPAYYALVAVGVVSVVNWGCIRLPFSIARWQMGLVALGAMLLFSGGQNFYDLFYRWANHPQVIQAFDESVVDSATYFENSESDVNVFIPFYLYTHASMRYVLHDSFQETVFLPQEAAVDLNRQKEATLIIPEYPDDDGEPVAYVWLRKPKAQPGTAYVSMIRRDAALNKLPLEFVGPIEGSRGNVIGREYRVDSQILAALFSQQMPDKRIAAAWADNLRLISYEFVPATINAGQIGNLRLTWELLGYTGLQEKMFLQLLDAQGQPAGQQELKPISKKMYRWRKEGLVLEEFPIRLGDDLSAGLYFIRLGFFDLKTGQRLSAFASDDIPLGNELIVGPLYVTTDEHSPTKPQYSVRAMLGEEIEFLGYSIHSSDGKDTTEVELFWKSRQAIKQDYTVFVQVLDDQNQIVAQVDAQPLANVYPTSRWQPGEIISDIFVLPIAEHNFYSESKLIAGMYNAATGERLSVSNEFGELLPGNFILLENSKE